MLYPSKSVVYNTAPPLQLHFAVSLARKISLQILRKLITFLLVALTVVNIFIYLKRDSYTYTKQSSYYELYPVYKDLNIRSFDLVSDSLVRVNTKERTGKASKWVITNRNTGSSTTYTGTDPLFAPRPGIATYNIHSGDYKDSLEFEIEYIPPATLKGGGVSAANRITLFHSDLPVRIKPSLEKWQQNKLPATARELAAISSVIKDSIKLTASDNSLSKAQKISRYLCSRISAARGIMSDSVLHLSVCEQYYAALASHKIDCGAYSNIFSLFATQAGITNRVIEIQHRYGTFNTNIHLFNEYYIEETGQWAATDIMLNNINYFDAAGKFLNGVEIKNWSRTDSTAYVTQVQAGSDSVSVSRFSNLTPEFFHYYSRDKDLYYYYSNNPGQVYSTSDKLKRYFLKDAWYEVYSDVSIADNKLFYLKQLLLLTWAIIFAVFIAGLFSKKLSNTKKAADHLSR